jgi:uncharacterized membrane protein YfhO
VASRPSCDYYGIRGLLSCKYLFDQKYDDDTDCFVNDEKQTEMPGWKYLKTVNDCKVYENQYYIPMGFMYESFISEEEYEKISKIDRSEALLKAMVLSMDDMEKYSDITGYTKEKYDVLRRDIKSGKTHNFKSIVDSYRYGNQSYYEDCEKLKENSCSSFTYHNNGFIAQIDNKGDDNLVFFSVPYDEGWSATVNGEKAEIVKSNIGFMAVKVPGNTKSIINFEYTVPAFHTGIIITIVCGIILLIYLFILIIFAIKRKGNRG